MNIFDILLIQPIFNVLVVLYGLIPGGDLGVALIVFTILIRLAMWPLVKKQLHQTKVMRVLQPKLMAIKKKAKGNRQLESQMMLELYREHGINPFSQIGLLLVQLPIFIALFTVVRLITENHENIAKYTYDFLEGIPGIAHAIANNIDHHLFGIIDLSKIATQDGAIYWPLLVLAVIAAILQYFQSKQLLPQPTQKKRLRDMLKEQAAGKDIDQAEMSALMTGKMSFLFPILTFLISMYLAGALVVYLVVSSAVAIIQQDRALKQDTNDLEKLSEKTKTKVSKAKEAVVVAEPAPKKKGRAQAASKKKKRS